MGEMSNEPDTNPTIVLKNLFFYLQECIS